MVHFNSRRSIIKCDTDENFGALMERLEVNLGSETVAEVQWRSEGFGRPGAKCTNGAPPGPRSFTPRVWPNPKTEGGGGGGGPLEFGQIRILGGGGGEFGQIRLLPLAFTDTWIQGGVPLRLAKSGADPGFRCGGKVMAWRDTPTPASGVWGGAPTALQLSHFLSHKT